MRTDQLIESLVAELKPVDRTRISRALLSALTIGAMAALSMMFAVFGAIPNLLSRPHPDVFVGKLLFGVGVAATAATILPKLARPRAGVRNSPALVFVPFIAIVAVAVSALAPVSVTEWSGMIFEEHSIRCLLTIPLLAIAPFMALVWALRLGAPTDLPSAGEIAGLVAAGLGATACALPCVDHWIPAVAIWYGVPIGICALLGARLGPRLLRW
ncbi:DUF1109 domain-containing protein [Bradyrhizobium sp. 61]|uniref:DUF1109 domain-containing protein n=1 Tax=unclassified Bradyrhizobium TaxID=2631580 RepID=UPI001FFAAB80|nr:MULTISPECIES: DUF1109 domain-containing protein [unclassified Bradyrhizobium]MCK1277383.1 DUF1109 domain-containing protein [Bradyrhizobium sp. 61]MCK1440950.1 DUF1109 domain-containing protein [Bradyrhizobium sp. 48]MCK1465610.1 DUF1109 domain-containing protein [Bradyrhizobium sp. 2]